jgi:hypothetical protein
MIAPLQHFERQKRDGRTFMEVGCEMNGKGLELCPMVLEPPGPVTMVSLLKEASNISEEPAPSIFQTEDGSNIPSKCQSFFQFYRHSKHRSL